MTINERVIALEKKIAALTNKTNDLSRNTEEKYQTPISIVGGSRDWTDTCPVDIKAGLGQKSGGFIIWNSSELKNPPANVEPPVPDSVTGKGYNKHTHTRFSGGALIKGGIEIVEFDFVTTPITNIHSQQFWQTQPGIKTEVNTNGETVEKIGLLDLIFNPDTKTWGTPAYEIDVKKCYLVERDEDGNISLDSNGNEKKSLLYNDVTSKSSIVWDENARVFRFYAVYSPGD
jgi:hypothetical protein